MHSTCMFSINWIGPSVTCIWLVFQVRCNHVTYDNCYEAYKMVYKPQIVSNPFQTNWQYQCPKFSLCHFHRSSGLGFWGIIPWGWTHLLSFNFNNTVKLSYDELSGTSITRSLLSWFALGVKGLCCRVNI